MIKTLEVRKWQPVEVEVVTSRFERRHDAIVLIIRLRDMQTNEIVSRITTRYGDIALSLQVLNSLRLSTLKTDKANYPVGKKFIAYRSPDGKDYVLEQNALSTMLVVFVLACLYPAYTIWYIKKKSKKNID